MLVLSRKSGDAVVIDGDIKIQVLDVRGGVVRLGIEAPKQVPVFREELWSDARAAANREYSPRHSQRVERRPACPAAGS